MGGRRELIAVSAQGEPIKYFTSEGHAARYFKVTPWIIRQVLRGKSPLEAQHLPLLTTEGASKCPLKYQQQQQLIPTLFALNRDGKVVKQFDSVERAAHYYRMPVEKIVALIDKNPKKRLPHIVTVPPTIVEEPKILEQWVVLQYNGKDTIYEISSLGNIINTENGLPLSIPGSTKVTLTLNKKKHQYDVDTLVKEHFKEV